MKQILAFWIMSIQSLSSVRCLEYNEFIADFLEAGAAGARCNLFIVGNDLHMAYEALQESAFGSRSALLLYSDVDHLGVMFASSISILTREPVFCSLVLTTDSTNVTRLDHAFIGIKNVTFVVFGSELPEMLRHEALGISGRPGSGHLIHQRCPLRPAVSLVNHWDPEGRFTILSSKTICGSPLRGRTIAVSVPLSAYRPYVVVDEHNQVTGVETSMIAILAEKLGFKVDLVKVDTWDTMIIQVASGACDIGLGDLSFNEVFAAYVDFTHYYTSMNTVISAPKPGPLLPFLNILSPFALSTWITVVVATLAVILVNYAVMVEDRSVRSGGTDYSLVEFASVATLEAIGTLLNQGEMIYRNPDRVPKELLLWFWFIGNFFIKSFFTSLLLLHLIKIEMSAPVETVDDIVAQGRHLWVQTPLLTDFFKGSSQESFKTIYKQIVDNNQYTVEKNGMFEPAFEQMLIDRGDCYLLTYKMTLAMAPKIEARYGYQPFRISTNAVFPGYGTFFTPKKSIYADELNDVIKFLVSSGIVDHLEDLHIANRYLVKEREDDTRLSAITIKHFLSAVICLAIGLVLAGIVFTIELRRPPLRHRVPTW